MSSAPGGSAAKSASSRLRIIVLGYLVRGPLGGLAWHHLQYVLGLARMGHDVYFFEDSDDYPSCYNPAANSTDIDPTYGLDFATNAFGGVGLPDRWCYYDYHQDKWHGPASGRVHELSATADLLLNLSGVNPLRVWLRDIPVRVLVDTDPTFTQIMHLMQPERRQLALLHHAFFSFGENFGSPTCSIPDDGFAWQPTRQPVVTDVWPATPGVPQGKITTVMQWNSYRHADYLGVRYGMKSASFPQFWHLPERLGPVFELAMGSHSGVGVRELTRRGWILVDPLAPTRDPWTYQRYIQSSRAEFGVAKQGYVATRSGWFSERSTCYLASGRPVLAQDTGFSDWLPTGDGLLSFSTVDDVLRAIEELDRRYEHHCRAARELVEEYFSSDRVLSSLIDRAYARPCGAPLAGSTSSVPGEGHSA